MTFQVDPGARPLLPIDGATGVTTATQFSWSAPPAGTVARAVFNIYGWRIQHITRAQKTTLPDLTPYGITVPANTTGDWSVTARGPAASVDEAASLLAFETGLHFGSISSGLTNPIRLGATYLYSYSESQSFKTAP
jgi:hypothetical protein